MRREPYRSSNKIINKAASELGQITIEWAAVENSIDELITLLVPLPDGPMNDAVLGNVDIRGKVQILRGAAFIQSIDNDWRDDIIFMLDVIDNDLRTRRNTAIHARWIIPSGKLHRRTRRTKIVRPQARQLILETEQNIPVKLSELRSLLLDLQLVTLCMMVFYWYMQGPDGRIDRETSPTISYKRYLQAAGLGNPLQQIRARQLRRRESAPANPKRPK